MPESKFMEMAIEAALDNVETSHGGPFGAVVVKDGTIIAYGRNEVTAANDPTAHAEVQAIREACQKLNTFQLTDCEIYTSCEPCPMCIGAIYWARPKAVYYACTKEEAGHIGFDDDFIYKELSLPMERRSIKMEQLLLKDCDMPFRVWGQTLTKVEY
ncbi:nucleoside deaminase [Peribacillus sp. SCS-155]|uniref:nucleoside deaminase n=1 Tax=Peribacillus sedimenti TaxID=3115297 RepID=UPI003905BA4A